jgi:branched-chain amino acid transport system permease protein
VNGRAAARTFFARAAAWRPLEFVFWAAVVASVFVFPTRLFLINEVAIFALFALSLDLLLGYAGIVSLGHAAFFGAGAYVAGLLAANGFGDPLAGLAIAAVVSGCLGFVTSPLILRGSDLTRLMITLGVASILAEIANRASDITGGANGLSGVTMTPLLGLFSFDLRGHTAAGYSLTVLFILFLVARVVTGSPFGLSLRAIRVNRLRAGAIGVPTSARLIAVYTIGAVYAGIAGALLAQTTQFVSLDVLAFHRSADVLLAVVLGGGGTLYGALIGAIVFRVAQDVLSGLTPQYWEFWIGFILVAVVLIGRDRVARLWRWRQAASAMAGPP